jgi:phage shock protein A
MIDQIQDACEAEKQRDAQQLLIAIERTERLLKKLKQEYAELDGAKQEVGQTFTIESFAADVQQIDPFDMAD